MKKQLFLLMFLAVAALTSCNKNEDLQEVTADETTMENVTFTIVSDDVATRTDATMRYIMEVYSDASATAKVNCFGNLDTHRAVQTGNGTFSATLDKTVTYTILFWADNFTADGTYNADNLKAVKLAEGKPMTEHAYFAYFRNTVGPTNDIPLKHAVAKINYIQNGTYTDKLEKTITITYADAYTFNCVTSDVTITPPDASKKHKFVFSKVVANGTIGTDYTFATANSGDATLLNLEVKVGAEATNKTLASVPFTANKVTNITGQYSSQAQVSEFTITPNSDWEETSNEKPLE